MFIYLKLLTNLFWVDKMANIWLDPAKVSASFATYVNNITAHEPSMDESHYKTLNASPIFTNCKIHQLFFYEHKKQTLDSFLYGIANDKCTMAIISAETKIKDNKKTREPSQSLMTACKLFMGSELLKKHKTTDVSLLMDIFKSDRLCERNWIRCYNSLSVILSACLHNLYTESTYRNKFTKIGRDKSRNESWKPAFPSSFLNHVDVESQQIAKSAGFNFSIMKDKAKYSKTLYTNLIATCQSDILEIDCEKLTNMVSTLIESKDDFIDKLLLVQLSTGARFIEVCKVSEFLLPVEDLHYPDVPSMEQRISIRGVAKAQKFNADGKEITTKRMILPKPVLFMTPADVIKTINACRTQILSLCNKKKGGPKASSLHAFSNDFVTTVIIKMALKRLKSFDLTGETAVGTHLLRKLYASLSYTVYAPKNMTKVAWIKEVLGHTGFDSVLAYNTVQPNIKRQKVQDSV